MDRARLSENTEKEMEDIESQKQNKNEKSLRHIVYHYVWYFLFTVMVLSTLAGLCMLAVKLGMTRIQQKEWRGLMLVHQ